MHVNLITEHCFGLIRKLRAGMPVFFYVLRRKIMQASIFLLCNFFRRDIENRERV